MKHIAAFVFAFLAVCYLQATDANAQFRRECRAGFCTGGGTASSIPVSNACINSSGSTITFTAQGTGTVNANRVSVVSINWSDSTAAGTAQITGVTIGGIAMARAIRATNAVSNSNSEIWFVSNPTGTTANIVVTAATAIDGITIEVYSLIGYNSGVPVATTTGTTSASQAYTNKQVAIAAGSRTVNVSTSLSNMTNDYSSACGASLWGVHASQRLSGSSTLTSSISPSTTNPKIALAVWAQAAPATCSQATAFLARTSGLTPTYTAAYTTFICGLVSDGVWAKLDFLHLYATQDSTTALLNLVSSSFNGTVNGSPTFAVGKGFTGVAAGTTVYINTNFNPNSGTPLFTRNAAHASVWNLSTGTDNNACIGAVTPGPNNMIYMPTRTGFDNSAYFRINGGNDANHATNAGIIGSFIGNRTTSTAAQGFINGVSAVTDNSTASTAIQNLNVYTLAFNNNGTANTCGFQTAQASAGGALTGTDAANYYARLHLWMQTFAGQP